LQWRVDVLFKVGTEFIILLEATNLIFTAILTSDFIRLL
jgi:hypothetical protein